MNIEINLKKFKDAVGLIERIAGKHQTLPVLSCILLEFGKNTLSLRATNLDVGVEISMPAKTSGEGTVAIPAHTLSAFLSQVQDSGHLISIDVSSGNVLVKTERSKGVIKTLPVDDFPVIPHIQDGESVPISPEQFITGLSSVSYSAAISSVKPELSSVYMYKDGEYITFVATDSFRLAEKKVSSKGIKIPDILIPYKNISDIVRILQSFTGDVTLKVNKNLLSFEGDGVYVVSRVIDGVFPDYRQIIPKSFTTEVVALKQDILNALKISHIFSDKFNQVHMTVDPKEKIFEIQTKNSDIGENQTNINANLTGDRMEINFNHRYLLDGFQYIPSDSVSLQLNGLNRPLVIKPVSGDQTFLYLVMPMNR